MADIPVNPNVTLTPEQVTQAQAREDAGAAAAAAQNAAWRNNTAPVLPRMGSPVSGGDNELIRVYDTTGLTDPRNQAGVARDITRAEYIQTYGRTPEASEQAKRDYAFSPIDYGAMANLTLSEIASRYGSGTADRVQDYYQAHPSARAQAITSEYNARHGVVENPFNPDTAAGIAWEVQRVTGGGGMLTTSLITESQSSVDRFGEKKSSYNPYGALGISGISTVPTRDLSSGMLSGSKLVAALPDQTTTINTPWGEFVQTPVANAKGLMDYQTGELGVYVKPYGHSQYMLTAGGGRAALQSGMFTFGEAETPYVVKPEDVGSYVMPSGKGMSRLGAEAYAGFVQPLDGRTLTTEDAISRYGNWNNLANYVQQIPAGKAEVKGADIPWSVSPSTPALSYMNDKGVIPGSAVSVAGSDRLVGSKVVASTPSYGSEVGVLPAQTPSVKQPTYFEEVGNWIKTAPILGAIYSAGQSVPSETKEQVRSFVQTAPIAESIYKGGRIFELKTDTDKAVAEKVKGIEPLVSSYESGVSAYSVELGEYNKSKTAYDTQLSAYENRVAGYQSQVSSYEKNKTESKYNELLGIESGLKSQQTNLESMQTSLGSKQASLESKYTGLELQRTQLELYQKDIDKTREPYTKAASEITGGVDQKVLATYGVGSWFGGVASGYESSIEAPIKSSTKGWGIVGEFIGGVADVPRQIAFMGQAGTIGGETMLRSAPTIPGIAAAGVAMQGKGMYEMATTKPAELAGSLVGMAVIGAVVKGGISKGVGEYRTAGMEYVPIERIGYGPEGRYPLNPIQSASSLSRSFAEGKLYPAPQQMAEGGAVPYLHGEGGLPVARLPNAQPGQTTLYTALESSSRVRGVGIGEAYRLQTSGGSEVQGMYGAPIVESYFAKVGGVIPKMVGVDLPFKTPTIYSTVVEGVEAVPKAVRDTAKTGDYTQVNTYVQARSAAVPAGQAYMPLLKPEYEAIVPDNSMIVVTRRNYYTKLGGFGSSHFLGEKVPIIEQRSIGFDTTIPQNRVKSQGPTENVYYSGNKPIINLAYSPAAASITPSVSSSGGSPRTSPTKPAAYSDVSSGARSQASSYRTPPSGGSYSKSGMSSPKESGVSRGSSNLYGGSSLSSPSSIRLSEVMSYKPSGSSAVPSSVSVMSGGLYPASPTPPSYVSPYSPVSPSKYVPPSSYKSPTPSYTPTPPGLLFPGGGFDWGGAGGATPSRNPRRAAFMETFNFGLDIGGMGGRMRTKKAKSFTTPKSKKRGGKKR
jgi:hypothetical protein